MSVLLLEQVALFFPAMYITQVSGFIFFDKLPIFTRLCKPFTASFLNRFNFLFVPFSVFSTPELVLMHPFISRRHGVLNIDYEFVASNVSLRFKDVSGGFSYSIASFAYSPFLCFVNPET